MANITLITRNFPPLTGGMERLVHQIYLQLVKRHQCNLVGPGGCQEFTEPGHRVIETKVSPTSLFLILSLLKSVFCHVVGPRPDVVIGGSGLVAPVVVLVAMLFRAKSIIIIHGLDIVADSRAYQWFFVPFLRHADLLISNSRNTSRLAIDSGVHADRIEIIFPGVFIPEDLPMRSLARASLDLDGKTLLLSVGRLIPRKGLAEFISAAFVELAANNPNYVFWIAGDEPRNGLAKQAGSVLEAVRALIEENTLEDRVRLVGRADDALLEQLYLSADAFIFPLIETRGDVEGFGMVAVEAAVYGTPTIAFDCGGVGDAVENGKSGYLVAAGDYPEFGRRIVQVVEDDMRVSVREFAQRFSWKSYSQQLQTLIDGVLYDQ
jgi:phosphatidylinositol alpha-1,6-mannosyltransferase